jgi:hypothetical protein
VRSAASKAEKEEFAWTLRPTFGMIMLPVMGPPNSLEAGLLRSSFRRVRDASDRFAGQIRLDMSAFKVGQFLDDYPLPLVEL